MEAADRGDQREVVNDGRLIVIVVIAFKPCIGLPEIVISHDKTILLTIPGGHERTHETHAVEENLEDPIS